MPENELNVLMLEDNAGDAFLIKFYLEESTSPTFKVSHTETLKATLDLLKENKYDIIISDMNVPDSFGMDTVKSILTAYPGNMLIVLTGLTDEEVGLETVRYGAQDFLVKGKFDGKVLISTLMFAFERFKLNRRLDEENDRIVMLQQLTQAGYFEIDIDSGSIFLTDYTLDLTHALDRSSKVPFSERFNTLENADQLFAIIEKSKSEPQQGEISVKRKADGSVYTIHYQSVGNKFYGILKS